MIRQLPQTGWMGDITRGAAMGRCGRGDATTLPHKFSLRVICRSSQAYDSAGAYWGLGSPVYWACSEDGRIERFFRARTRELAKRIVRDEFPEARFYR